MKKYIAKTIDDLLPIAHDIIANYPDERIFLLEGDMGAGKTTFAKYFGKALGSADNICSPTFALVNQYLTQDYENIYHFDFYRIEDPTEAFDIGFEEYLYSGDYCLIEWSQRVIDLIPPSAIIIQITEIEEKARRIRVISPN